MAEGAEKLPCAVLTDAVGSAARERAQSLSQALGIPMVTAPPASGWFLHLHGEQLSLNHASDRDLRSIRASLCSVPARRSRQLQHELLIRAIGRRQGAGLNVLDATAGLGGDAGLLAVAGFDVTLSERCAVVHALLQFAQLELPRNIQQRVQLKHADSVELMQKKTYDIIYLDPMFPAKSKNAKAKKAMQGVKQWLADSGQGSAIDTGAEALLHGALATARYRVIVKRSRRAPHLADVRPDFSVQGRLIRYDCFARRRLPGQAQ